MEFKNTMFAIIIFSMIILASALWVNQWSAAYDSGVNEDISQLSRLDEVSGDAEVQKGKINPQSGEASSDFETETFRGGYGIITNIYSTLRVLFGEGGIIDSVVTRFGIPTFVWQTVVSMIVLAITFAIIAIVFRRGQTTV